MTRYLMRYNGKTLENREWPCPQKLCVLDRNAKIKVYPNEQWFMEITRDTKPDEPSKGVVFMAPVTFKHLLIECAIPTIINNKLYLMDKVRDIKEEVKEFHYYPDRKEIQNYFSKFTLPSTGFYRSYHVAISEEIDSQIKKALLEGTVSGFHNDTMVRIITELGLITVDSIPPASITDIYPDKIKGQITLFDKQLGFELPIIEDMYRKFFIFKCKCGKHATKCVRYKRYRTQDELMVDFSMGPSLTAWEYDYVCDTCFNEDNYKGYISYEVHPEAYKVHG